MTSTRRRPFIITLADVVLKYAASLAWSVPIRSAETLLLILARALGKEKHGTLRLWCDALTRVWARGLLQVQQVRTSLIDHNRGCYDSPPYVFMCLNQSSLVEMPALLAVWPTREPLFVLQNVEYSCAPFLGSSSAIGGGITIVRQWKEQAKAGVLRCVERLKAGDSFYMSLEGRRSPDGKLQPYKKGGVVMALLSHATIVPVAFHGARQVLPYGSCIVRPGHVKVELLPTISTHGLTLDDRHELLQRLRELAVDVLSSAPPGDPPIQSRL